MSGARPLTRQRSPWRHAGTVPTMPGWQADAHIRNVGDGYLRALVAEEPTGWHLSVSFTDHRGRPSRYPRWDELIHARDALLPADRAFVMVLPTADEYVALHDTTFHLHEVGPDIDHQADEAELELGGDPCGDLEPGDERLPLARELDEAPSSPEAGVVAAARWAVDAWRASTNPDENHYILEALARELDEGPST